MDRITRRYERLKYMRDKSLTRAKLKQIQAKAEVKKLLTNKPIEQPSAKWIKTWRAFYKYNGQYELNEDGTILTLTLKNGRFSTKFYKRT